MMLSKVAVPINEPDRKKISLLQQNNSYDYFFAPIELFTFYTCEQSPESVFVQTMGNQWYFTHTFHCQDFDELKRTRQIHRPPYMKQDLLPLIDLLQHLQVQVQPSHFDKAYGHVLQLVDTVDLTKAKTYMCTANYDGLDDPFVTAQMNYIENEYNQQKTLFVAGIETKSFATITENQVYYEQIWPQYIGLSYLLLFIRFSETKQCPSEQMMPKLLCNLWASTSSLYTNFNSNLYKKLHF